MDLDMRRAEYLRRTYGLEVTSIPAGSTWLTMSIALVLSMYRKGAPPSSNA